MGSRSCKHGFRSLVYSIKELMQVLKHIVSRCTVRAEPHACDDCFLNPLLVLLLEKPHINQFVKCFACTGNTKIGQSLTKWGLKFYLPVLFQVVYVVHDRLEVGVIQYDSSYHLNKYCKDQN
jgi:hypothetical protein